MSAITLNTLFIVVSAQFNLPSGLLSSLCFIESAHNIEAVHIADGDSNSVGVCQIKLKTAQWLGFEGTEEELKNPYTNIYYAGAYLSHQYSRYNGRIDKAVIAYNMGHAGHLTTTEYQAKVFRQWRSLQ